MLLQLLTQKKMFQEGVTRTIYLSPTGFVDNSAAFAQHEGAGSKVNKRWHQYYFNGGKEIVVSDIPSLSVWPGGGAIN